MALLSSIFTYAVEEGYLPANPARGIALPGYTARTTRLDTTATEAGTRSRGRREGGAAWQNVLAIRAIALTGCRRGEITGLRKSEVDLAGQTLRLADTKTGESIRPVGKAAMDVIRAAVEKSGKSEFVFPARNGKGAFAGLPRGGPGCWPRPPGHYSPRSEAFFRVDRR